MWDESVLIDDDDVHTPSEPVRDSAGTSRGDNVSCSTIQRNIGKRKQDQVKSREKLKTLFDNIAKNTAVDYNNREIQDIQNAVWQMLAFVIKNINDDGLFKVSCIEPCGSMAEKSSVWKLRLPDISFLEFDFLAVLEKRSGCSLAQGCLGCMRVESLPCNADDSVRQRYNDRPNDQVGVSDLEDEFQKKVSDLMFRCTCGSDNCCIRYDPKHVAKRKRYYTGHHRRIWFSIRKPTGKLLASNWQTWKWKSTEKSLFCPSLLNPEHLIPVEELGIYIDLVPAIKLDRDSCFIVAKPCTLCSHGWRISGCKVEIDRFLCMSDYHRNCYRVLKYLYQFDNVYGQNYIMKTAVLRHITLCDREDDCTKCMFDILRDLRKAYQQLKLNAYEREANLLLGSEGTSGWGEKGNHLLMSSLSNFLTWEKLRSLLGERSSDSRSKHLEWNTMRDRDIDSANVILLGAGSSRHLSSEPR